MSERPAALLPNILLALAFLAFLIVGIVTVLVPELSGDSEAEEGGSSTESGASEQPSSSGDTSE